MLAKVPECFLRLSKCSLAKRNLIITINSKSVSLGNVKGHRDSYTNMPLSEARLVTLFFTDSLSWTLAST